MENKMILVDTTILIDFFRKTDKSNSRLIHLVDEGYQFSISAITAYEIFSGATTVQMNFWNEFLLRIKIYSFESSTVKNAVLINQQLKKKRKQHYEKQNQSGISHHRIQRRFFWVYH